MDTVIEINDPDWERKVLRHILEGENHRPEMREEAGKQLRELESNGKKSLTN